jgi:hypothetical protein
VKSDDSFSEASMAAVSLMIGRKFGNGRALQ